MKLIKEMIRYVSSQRREEKPGRRKNCSVLEKWSEWREIDAESQALMSVELNYSDTKKPTIKSWEVYNDWIISLPLELIRFPYCGPTIFNTRKRQNERN